MSKTLARFLAPLAVLLLSSSGSAGAQTFTDTFNRADGPVGNGWTPFGGGAVISNGSLETSGSPAEGGGVSRVLPVTLPAKIAFDFSTANPADGGWFVAVNATGTHPPGPPISEVSFMHFAGSRNIYRVLNDGGGQQFDFAPNLPEPIAGWQDFGPVPAHVELQINADLSTVIKITYGDNSEVLTTFGPTAAGPIGSMLVLGNADASSGPHTFDNLQVGPLELDYNICPAYDQTKPVKSGATLPLKVYLCDAGGSNLSSSGIVLHATGVRLLSNSVTGIVQDSGQANPDNNFRFSNGQYIFNLSTKGLGTGLYTLDFTVGNGPLVYTTLFQVK